MMWSDQLTMMLLACRRTWCKRVVIRVAGVCTIGGSRNIWVGDNVPTTKAAKYGLVATRTFARAALQQLRLSNCSRVARVLTALGEVAAGGTEHIKADTHARTRRLVGRENNDACPHAVQVARRTSTPKKLTCTSAAAACRRPAQRRRRRRRGSCACAVARLTQPSERRDFSRASLIHREDGNAHSRSHLASHLTAGAAAFRSEFQSCAGLAAVFETGPCAAPGEHSAVASRRTSARWCQSSLFRPATAAPAGHAARRPAAASDGWSGGSGVHNAAAVPRHEAQSGDARRGGGGREGRGGTGKSKEGLLYLRVRSTPRRQVGTLGADPIGADRRSCCTAAAVSAPARRIWRGERATRRRARVGRAWPGAVAPRAALFRLGVELRRRQPEQLADPSLRHLARPPRADPAATATAVAATAASAAIRRSSCRWVDEARTASGRAPPPSPLHPSLPVRPVSRPPNATHRRRKYGAWRAARPRRCGRANPPNACERDRAQEDSHSHEEEPARSSACGDDDGSDEGEGSDAGGDDGPMPKAQRQRPNTSTQAGSTGCTGATGRTSGEGGACMHGRRMHVVRASGAAVHAGTT
eukprot:365027-Chlamydomonas_euryale.AAC.10